MSDHRLTLIFCHESSYLTSRSCVLLGFQGYDKIKGYNQDFLISRKSSSLVIIFNYTRLLMCVPWPPRGSIIQVYIIHEEEF